MRPLEAPRDPLSLFRPYSTLRAAQRSLWMGGLAAVADVLLLLYLFVFFNLPFVLQPGIVLDLPETELTGGAPYASSIVVTMAQEDLIFLNDERTTMAGLKDALQRATYQKPEATLLIEADARVTYESIVRIYAMARELGVSNVVLATRGRSR